MNESPLERLRGKAVLITGGTAGIGLATGLAFGRAGAHCVLTYKWGSADEDAIRNEFAWAGAAEPLLVRADVADPTDTAELLPALHDRFEAIEVFVSNVAYGLVVNSLADYSARALARTLDYTAWPLVEYTRRIKEVFGQYPRYVIGLSSAGPDQFYDGYDMIAAAKSVLETLARYLSHRLAKEDVRVNVVRAYAVLTDSFRATFGQEFESFAQTWNMAEYCITPEEVAGTILALCSGLMDAVTGQVINVDRGAIFSDNFMRFYAERKLLAKSDSDAVEEDV